MDEQSFKRSKILGMSKDLETSHCSSSGTIPGRNQSEGSIPAEHVAVLFRCVKCLEAPVKFPAYTCIQSHLTCTDCYQKLNRCCHVCKAPLIGRNKMLEEVVCNLPASACESLAQCSVPLTESRSEQCLQSPVIPETQKISLQDPSHLEKLEKARKEAEENNELLTLFSSVTDFNTVCLRASHKPVMCPYPCGRIVTCSGLFPHFESHHPKVNVSIVHRESLSTVQVKLKDCSKAESRVCLLYILKLEQKSQDNCNQLTPASLLHMKRSEYLRPGCIMATLSVGRLEAHSSYTEADGTGDADDDWNFDLVIWVGCLYESSPVTYTVTASTEFSLQSTSFTGPLVSMHLSQRPQDVLANGDCLFISSGTLRKMQAGDSPLKLCVTFHSQIPCYDEVLHSPVFDRDIKHI